MDSMTINKTAAAALTAGIAFFAAGLLGDVLVSPTKLQQSAIKIDPPAKQVATAGPAQSGPPAITPIEPLLVSADASVGQAYATKVCSACHSLNDGGKAGIGPNLYGVVGRPEASMEGYAYSAALKAKGGKWTYAELNQWLYKPAAYAKGTKMSYAGITNDKDRAAVIAYLRSLAATPEPLPTAEQVSAASAAAKAPAPAAGGAAAAAPPAGEQPFAILLASADPANGQKLTLKQGCVACHSLNEGGKAGIGPNLYGVVGAPHGHMEGYAYSAALKGKEGPWTYDELNAWLTKPSAYAPGTKMSYAGLANAKDRADIIAYLKSISPNAPALPEAKAGG